MLSWLVVVITIFQERLGVDQKFFFFIVYLILIPNSIKLINIDV